MNGQVQAISALHLSLIFLPAMAVIAIFFQWGLRCRDLVYALARMLLQLLIVGYLLLFIFTTTHWAVVAAVLALMAVASSWIALRVVKEGRLRLFPLALMAVALGGGSTLVLVILGVLRLEPWYLPRYVIPLAGMIFAASMNTISLAAERYSVEIRRSGLDHEKEARRAALAAALIPRVNSLYAVGLVSLPGMMTGQILSGVSPLVAVRYQIMVMCMIFGASGISAALFLTTARRHFASALKKEGGAGGPLEDQRRSVDG